MNQAEKVIDKFGSQSQLARLLGKGQSTIQHWASKGIIPAKWHGTLLALAEKRGISLCADDFVQKPETLPAPDAATSKDIVILTSEPQQADFIFYASSDGSIKVQVAVGDETVWASQKGMAEIFSVEANTIGYHLKNIFDSSELSEDSVTRKIRATAADNKTYMTTFYNLDAIISVGYRVNSYQATQFRKWATSILREYLVKGFALNDDRLKQGNQLFGKDYFDELLERIREIRSSERRFYQKITDIYRECSVDYDKNSPMTQQFYAHVQNKILFAISGHTSAELIESRADASKPKMGLYSYKNEKKHGKITKSDVTVSKNYLTQSELDDMNRLVSMYLDSAENFARRHRALTMKDWIERLDQFLEFNAYDVLKNYGRVRHDDAERRAIAEYEVFRVKQDIEFKSDFDEMVDKIKTRKALPNKTD
jgi:hypothetical protein